MLVTRIPSFPWNNPSTWYTFIFIRHHRRVGKPYFWMFWWHLCILNYQFCKTHYAGLHHSTDCGLWIIAAAVVGQSNMALNWRMLVVIGCKKTLQVVFFFQIWVINQQQLLKLFPGNTTKWRTHTDWLGHACCHTQKKKEKKISSFSNITTRNFKSFMSHKLWQPRPYRAVELSSSIHPEPQCSHTSTDCSYTDPWWWSSEWSARANGNVSYI